MAGAVTGNRRGSGPRVEGSTPSPPATYDARTGKWSLPVEYELHLWDPRRDEPDFVAREHAVCVTDALKPYKGEAWPIDCFPASPNTLHRNREG